MQEIKCTNCDAIIQPAENAENSPATCPLCSSVTQNLPPFPSPAPDPDYVEPAESDINSDIFALNFAIQKLKKDNKTILPKLVIIPFVIAAILSLIFMKNSGNIRLTFIAVEAVLLSAYFIFIRRMLHRRVQNLQQRLKEIKTPAD